MGYSSASSFYEMAYELSWTTFTTVGYGNVAPSGDKSECYTIRIACSLFAFMGLLFNSLSAAIFFSKLERVLTRASVSFCSTACLQFGEAALFTRGSKGVYGQLWMKNNTQRCLKSSVTSQSSADSFAGDNIPHCESTAVREARARRTAPFPFLEFRMVNDHANYKNRAVLHARVNAMVQLSTEDADNARGSQKGDPQGSRRQSGVNFREHITFAPKESKRTTPPTMDELDEMSESYASILSPNFKMKQTTKTPTKGPMLVQETDSNGKAEGRVYYPLELEPSEHPYFKSVWYFRHILNAHSPLLTRCVREQIKRDGGWDIRISTYQDILASLVNFRRIRITFKGTSAVSNSLGESILGVPSPSMAFCSIVS